MIKEYLKILNEKLKEGPTFFRHVGEILGGTIENKYVSGFIDSADEKIHKAGGYASDFVRENKYPIATSAVYIALILAGTAAREHTIIKSLGPDALPNYNVGGDTGWVQALNLCRTVRDSGLTATPLVAVGTKVVEKGVKYRKNKK